MAEAEAEDVAGPRMAREATEEASRGVAVDQDIQGDLLLRGAMDLDDFRCPICLELAYKPVVNACGHVFCFWCVHKAMSPFADSHCPMCRRAFTHFPRTCALLHHLLVRAFPAEFAAREADVKAEEARSQVSSPEVLSLEEDAQLGQRSVRLGSQSTLAGAQASGAAASGAEAVGAPVGAQGSPPTEWLQSACTCLSCSGILYQPVVLNCGHALCRPCVNQVPQRRHSPPLKSQPLQGPLPSGTSQGIRLPTTSQAAMGATEHTRESSAAPRTEEASVPAVGDAGAATIDQAAAVVAAAASSAAEAQPLRCGTGTGNGTGGAAGSPWACPGCGMRQPTQAFAVCSQLHETLERLFPEALARRGREARRATGKAVLGEEGANHEQDTKEAGGVQGVGEVRQEGRYCTCSPPASPGYTHAAQGSRAPHAGGAECDEAIGPHGASCAGGVRCESGAQSMHQAPWHGAARAFRDTASWQAAQHRSGHTVEAEGSGERTAGARGMASATSRARGNSVGDSGRASAVGDSLGTPRVGSRPGERGAKQGGPKGASAGCTLAASGAAAEMGAVQRAWARIQAAQQRVAQARSEEEALEMQQQLKREREEHHIHVGVGCDCCGAYPIIGRRYRCVDCNKHFERIGFDLCRACHSADVSVGRFNQRHTPEHRLEEVPGRGDAFQRFFEANHPDTVALLMSILQDDAEYPGYSDFVTVGQDGIPVSMEAPPPDGTGLFSTPHRGQREYDGGNSNEGRGIVDVREGSGGEGSVQVPQEAHHVEGEGEREGLGS